MTVESFVSSFIPESDKANIFTAMALKKHCMSEYKQQLSEMKFFEDGFMPKVLALLNQDQRQKVDKYVSELQNEDMSEANKIIDTRNALINHLKSLQVLNHPITKKEYRLSSSLADNSYIYSGLNITQGIPIVNENIVLEDIFIFFNNGKLDIVYYSDKITKQRKSFLSEYEKMKFPLDCFEASEFNKIVFILSVYAYALENNGYKIGSLISSGPKQVIVSYKRWEVCLMLKYYKWQHCNSYQKKYVVI
ncbi:MAG: hypothetical protein IT245_06785 [Bacteroidia bacterium]|nr:hypothetical protein [Bacteroidia bacterium]